MEFSEAIDNLKQLEKESESRMREIRRLRNVVSELCQQLDKGRDYLMSVEHDKINVPDALEAFGFGKNGLGM